MINSNCRYTNATLNLKIDDISLLWHSDISYDPCLTTFFWAGHTRVSTLRRFSTQFVAFLRTLKAVHSGVDQAQYSRAGRRGGTVRREPVENVHPVVRKHPVTGEEALYVNRQFTRRIVGLKREESGEPCILRLVRVEENRMVHPDNILNFLFDHVDKSGDNQVRVKWTPYTVVLWDNRITAHVSHGGALPQLNLI